MENFHAKSITHLLHGSDHNCGRNLYFPACCASYDRGNPRWA
jgi:hypothetical protein